MGSTAEEFAELQRDGGEITPQDRQRGTGVMRTLVGRELGSGQLCSMIAMSERYREMLKGTGGKIYIYPAGMTSPRGEEQHLETTVTTGTSSETCSEVVTTEM